MPSSAQLPSKSDNVTAILVIAACTATSIMSFEIAPGSCLVIQDSVPQSSTVTTIEPGLAETQVSPMRRTLELMKLRRPRIQAIPFAIFGINLPTAQVLWPEAPATDLSDLIRAERNAARIDPNFISAADAAVGDALFLVQNVSIRGTPAISLSDEGILGLQWQKDDYGAALLFAGDGVVSIALKKPSQFYAENGIDVPISSTLPAEFTSVLAKITS